MTFSVSVHTYQSDQYFYTWMSEIGNIGCQFQKRLRELGTQGNRGTGCLSSLRSFKNPSHKVYLNVHF